MQLVATLLDNTMLGYYHIYSYHIDFSSKRRLSINSQYLGLRAERMD